MTGTDPHMREFAREFRALVGPGSYKDSGAPMCKAEISRVCNGHRLPAIAALRQLLRSRVATPEEIEYWELRWVVAYQHLEASGSRVLVRRPGEAVEVLAIAEQNADRLQALADEVRDQQDLARERARLAAEEELAKLDQSIPNSRPKVGYGPAACWADLTDYLRRLLLLFTDPRKREDRDGVTMQEILADLARLPDLTGVAGWEQLAEDIAAAYDKAQRNGWEVMLAGSDTSVPAEAYFDRYAGFRAEAGQRAAQLARQSAFLADNPVVFPSVAIDLDRYDPPRSHYRHAVPVSAACASALAVPWVLTDAPVPWLWVGTYSAIVFLGMLITLLDARAHARPD